ncbi:hypothetical protein GCM10010336_19980 [Streptomyces goshikiensis]|nr:hypothetical protein GCM10010336_19980 [Streptomyces goshikiensis]
MRSRTTAPGTVNFFAARSTDAWRAAGSIGFKADGTGVAVATGVGSASAEAVEPRGMVPPAITRAAHDTRTALRAGILRAAREVTTVASTLGGIAQFYQPQPKTSRRPIRTA